VVPLPVVPFAALSATSRNLSHARAAGFVAAIPDEAGPTGYAAQDRV